MKIKCKNTIILKKFLAVKSEKLKPNKEIKISCEDIFVHMLLQK